MPQSVEDIVDALIAKGEILPSHRELAISELDRHLQNRAKSIVRNMAMLVDVQLQGLLHVPN